MWLVGLERGTLLKSHLLFPKLVMGQNEESLIIGQAVKDALNLVKGEYLPMSPCVFISQTSVLISIFGKAIDGWIISGWMFLKLEEGR